jgi:bacteriocin biosynthesis cyclodehydratase domain-containing protein
MTDTTDRTTGEGTWRVVPGVRALDADGDLLLRTGGRIVKVSSTAVVPLVRHLLQDALKGELDLTGADELAPEQRQRFDAVLDKLAEAGLLDATDDGMPAEAGAVDGLWMRAGGEVERAEIARRLETDAVDVVGTGTLADRIASELATAGLRRARRVEDPADADPDATTSVVIGQSEEDPLLAAWNERALAAGGPEWLAVVPMDGQHVTVGPWVFPNTSACWQCFRLRRAAAFLDHEVGAGLASAVPVTPSGDVAAMHPTLSAMQATVVADVVLQHVALRGGHGQAQPGGMTTMEYGLTGLRTENHKVLRVPRCPQCSPAAGGGFPQVWFHRDAVTSGEGAR